MPMKDVRSTRRNLLRGGAAGAVAVAALAAGGARAQTPKIAKSAIMYQDSPKDGHQCSMCVNFLPPNACKIVEGDISPNGWCGAFAPKSA
jgi:hypothetical protein